MRHRPRRIGGATLTRRAVLRAGAAAGAAGLLGAGASGCAADFAGTRVSVGAGFPQGVYYALGEALADAWQERLDLRQRPGVLATAGSVQNLDLLRTGAADVIFSAADVADMALSDPTPTDPTPTDPRPSGAPPPGRTPRALARIYDDALQVVVPADSPVTALPELRGRRVSIGAADSGVIVIAQRLLAAAGLSAERDLTASMLGIDESVAALGRGDIEAFFWSGGLPTRGLADLATVRPIRLLDLSPAIAAVRRRYPVYDVGTVPAATYGIPNPVNTLLVRNFLLVAAEMPDPLAEALVAALFDERERLVRANPSGRVIDSRAAIGTQPVPLHPGARAYYRAAKDYD